MSPPEAKSPNIFQASKIEEIDQALSPRPLREDELDNFWIETDEQRDPHINVRERLLTELSRPGSPKVMLYGHMGCGKSTELVKFQSQHGGKFTFVSFSLLKEAMLSQANVPALLLLICERVVDYAKRAELEFDEEAMKGVLDWFKNTFEISEEEWKGSAGADSEVSAKSPSFFNFFQFTGRLQSSIKASRNYLRRTEDAHPQRLAHLSLHTGTVIREFNEALRKAGKNPPVIVIEDLDKLAFGENAKLFMNDPAPLAELPCRFIYVTPINLLSSARASSLGNHYTLVSFPMIHVVSKDGKPDREGGIKKVRAILAKRMDLSLIDDDALEAAIEKTGGVLRQLFEVISHAGSSTLNLWKRAPEGELKIQKANVEYGLDQVRKRLLAQVSTTGADPEFLKANSITQESLKARLREVGTGSVDGIGKVEDQILLEAQALLEYNGSGYKRVHPLLLNAL